MAELACAGVGESVREIVCELCVSLSDKIAARTSMAVGARGTGEGEGKGRLWLRGWFARRKE